MNDDYASAAEQLEDQLRERQEECAERAACQLAFDDPDHTCACSLYRAKSFKALRSGLPREYWHIEDLEPTLNQECFETARKYASNLPNAFKHGLGLLLTGSNGVGKTSCAALILLAQLSRGGFGRYVVWTDFLLSLSRCPKGQEGRLLASVYESPLLVLDEIGKDLEGISSAKTMLESVVRKRRASYLPTILISNLSKQELNDHYGATFASLLSGKYKPLPFKAGDFRKQAGYEVSWTSLLEGGDL